MPSLFRFLLIIGVIAGVIYGTMFTLVYFVEPNTRVMSERIPAERLDQ